MYGLVTTQEPCWSQVPSFLGNPIDRKVLNSADHLFIPMGTFSQHFFRKTSHSHGTVETNLQKFWFNNFQELCGTAPVSPQAQDPAQTRL